MKTSKIKWNETRRQNATVKRWHADDLDWIYRFEGKLFELHFIWTDPVRDIYVCVVNDFDLFRNQTGRFPKKASVDVESDVARTAKDRISYAPQ